jgi:hypothetical protein
LIQYCFEDIKTALEKHLHMKINADNLTLHKAKIFYTETITAYVKTDAEIVEVGFFKLMDLFEIIYPTPINIIYDRKWHPKRKIIGFRVNRRE